nr:putative neural-cadherin 2 isoform X2 [Procambarus clarkii]XP_045603725.1 putative neural-cadherin 2 isoform X2 [Procambarus clarkii]
MDPGKIFQIITNSTLLASRLLSGAGGPLQFSEPRYCLVVAEDAPPGLRVTQVTATHKDGVGVRYSITGGNRDGLFTIDQRSGLITLAAPLDYELQPKHELVVAAEAAGRTVHSMVQVTVADVNDNAPHFLQRDIQVAVVEEDDRHLPATIFKVEAVDPDKVDSAGLVYSVGGDGVDGHSPTRAFFTINPLTGHLLQLRALDRDPPLGRERWQVKVQVRDGQRVSPSLAAASRASRRPPTLSHPQHLHSHQPQVPPQAHALTTRNLGVPPQAHALTTRNLGVPPQAHALTTRNHEMPSRGQIGMSYNPEVTLGSQSVTSHKVPPNFMLRNRKVPPGGQFFIPNYTEVLPESGSTIPQFSNGPVQSNYFQSRDPNAEKGSRFLYRDSDAGKDLYFLPQNSAIAPEDPYFLLQDPLVEERTIQVTNKEDVEIGGRLGENVQQIRDEEQQEHISETIGRHTYQTEEKEEITVRKGSKREGENKGASKHLRKRGKFIPKRRRASERKRKLRDKNLQNTKEILGDKKRKMGGGRQSSSAGDRRRKPSPGRGYQVRGRKAGQQGLGAQVARRVSGSTSGCSDQYPRGTLSTANKYDIASPVRNKYFAHRKYDQIAVKCKRLSARGILNLASPYNAGGKINVARSHKLRLNSGFTYKGEQNFSETLAFTPKPHVVRLREVPRSRHNRSSPRRDSGRVEDLGEPVEHHRDNHLSAPSAVATTPSRTKGDLEGDLGDAKSEGKGSAAGKSTLLVNKREIRRQMPEERVYVKRLGRNGGGCEDYGSFSMSPEEAPEEEEAEPWYLQDMRREQVHVAETVVTVVVKDINDNAPVFPNATIYGEVQENGPIDLSVGVVWAWDADDEKEGTNALLTYTIEKNVMEERSGQAIFAINPETGLVRTAICCLDRETTPEYHIQVVAVDGGGLKGTGTVVVRLADVNDNSPRLTQDLWQVEVDETWGDGPPSNHTLLQVTTADHDTSNYFFYRVVEASGWGWQHFSMRTEGTSGHLYAGRTLDYEDAAQRRGFRFMVQVTDRGRGGWSDARHTDTAWVEVRLRDVNDNPPQFSRPHAHVTVREDTAPGTLLASLTATDPDMMEEQVVEYRVVGGWGVVTVDGVGGVRLWRALDRESPGGEVGVARVVAVDDGRPSLSSTATLTITLTDVNDCPPRLLPPTVLHVTEGAPASLLGILTATDDDVWALGHGPPFTFTLAPSNPTHVLNILSISYQADLDSGRGGAEVWTAGPLDREEHRQLTAEVVVADAQGLTAAHPITVIVDDINDNPMRPGAKTVYLWKMQGGGADAALGRVYVEDPDDWDLQDKTFAWAGPPHPLFTLQPNTGDIFASTQLREGRYELHFRVSDRVWGQQDVPANVTVMVRYLSLEALAHAVPVTLMPTIPASLTAGWTPLHGGGGLGRLTEAVMQVVGRSADAVEIVSVYGLQAPETFPVPTFPNYLLKPVVHGFSPVIQALPSPSPFACVWVSVRQADGVFIDPVKLHGLLALHLQHLERVMNLRVALEDAQTMEENNEKSASGSSIFSFLDDSSPHDPSSVASLASAALPLQVVDTNTTSLVTPRLTRAHDCDPRLQSGDETCTPISCLNGGRCVRTDIGKRCVCPGGSWGPQCKVLGRTFSGSGWAWVQPLPPCLPTTLSLRLLSRNPDALILYSGPLSSTSTHPHYPPTPMVALQLVGGQPQLILEGARGPVKLHVNTTLNTGTWHTIHLHLNAQGVTLMVDMCGRGWDADRTSDTHCIARAPWVDAQVTESWSSSVPLQLGGLAHLYPEAAVFGWSGGLVTQALNGCISRLTINGQLVDLGEPAYSSGSVKGCKPQEVACETTFASCGTQGSCVGGLINPRCDCNPGWTGPECTTPTVPVALGQASYTKVALSFTPDPHDVTLQLRVRARGRPEGLLMQLTDSQQTHALKLHLRGGVACACVSGVERALQEVCLEGFPVGDGAWHTIRVGRHGHNLIISVDDSDGWRQNETLTTLLTTTIHGDMQAVVNEPPAPLSLDMEDGILVGGIPKFVDHTLLTVHDDLQDCCVDDVRVSGHPLPLAPSVNSTSWSKVTTLHNIKEGCSAPDACANITCWPPLSCHDSWRHATCSCESGEQVVGHSCQDVDECVFQPCLHGGTCYNLTPGYHCLCAPAHTGDNCEWSKLPPDSHPLTAPMAIAALTLSVLIVVLIGVLLNLRLHRSRAARALALRPGGVEGVTGVVLGTPMAVQAVTDNPHTQAAKEESVFMESLMIKPPSKQIVLTPEGTEHLVTPLGLSTVGGETLAIREVRHLVPGNTTKIPSADGVENKNIIIPQRCSVAAVTTTTTTMGGVVLENRTVCSAAPTGARQIIIDVGVGSVQNILAQDDLRAYAYEGDGSPSGSLTSTVLGLRTESPEDNVKPLLPECGEVLDLLKNLPDSVTSAHSNESSHPSTIPDKSVQGSSIPRARETGINIT